MPAATTKYDLLAIDLDGTLLCPQGKVSAANIAAIRDARDAGIRVTICTGRGLIECRHIARRIEQTEPVIVAGGAIIACPLRESTVHKFAMDPLVVRGLVDCFTSHGHAALVLKDPSATAAAGDARGHDYIVVSPRGEDGIDPITRWWFKEHNVPVRIVSTIDHDEHPEHTVRVGICGTRKNTEAAGRVAKESFRDRTQHHHFGAVVPGADPDNLDDQIVILELFDRQVSKWEAIRWLAAHDGIPAARIAAIGNDINDIAMLSAAGLGIAVGNAIPEARAAATRHTLDNSADGVAHAIRSILDGVW